MLKQIVAIILFSLIVILTMSYLNPVLNLLISVHDWISEVLTQVFSGGKPGEISRKLIALLTLPFLVGLVPSLIYWGIRRSAFPYFMQLVWATWVVLVVALVAINKPM